MLIQTCSFNIFFPPSRKIREHLFEYENFFTGFQKPFNLIPIPPDAPNEIPRIIATTEHNHSQLMISGNSAQLTTKFDSAYNQDIKKCVYYVHEKCKSIIEALSKIEEVVGSNSRFYYSGMTMVISFDASDGIADPANYISSKFLKCNTNLPVDETQFRIALVVENGYYVNIMLQNNRNFIGNPDERGSFVWAEAEKENLLVTLDINDRYAFNHVQNYISSEVAVDHIAQLMEEFASEYLNGFIMEAELIYASK